MRTCIGCRRAGPTATLVRVVRSDTGSLSIDRTGPGRGAWLCAAEIAAGKGADGRTGIPAVSCFEQAIRRQAFQRALRAEVEATAIKALRDTVELRARIESGGTVRHQKGLT